MRLDQLPDVLLEQVVGHPEPAAGVEHLLREEEAVLAVQVADGACGLGEQMESLGLSAAAVAMAIGGTPLPLRQEAVTILDSGVRMEGHRHGYETISGCRWPHPLWMMCPRRR